LERRTEIMHELGKYLNDHMTRRGWSTSELARRAGLTKQSIGHLVDPDRDHLGRMLERRTFDGLAHALGVPSEVLVLKCAEAMGIPVPPPHETDPAAFDAGATLEQVKVFVSDGHLPDDVLLDYLDRCLELAGVITRTLLERSREEEVPVQV
jgi:transcriptional regulator with XRE-family HTH domain